MMNNQQCKISQLYDEMSYIIVLASVINAVALE